MSSHTLVVPHLGGRGQYIDHSRLQIISINGRCFYLQMASGKLVFPKGVLLFL